MEALSLISDPDLLALIPGLVLAERARSADVIEHLVEIDRRRLFLDQACRSLSCYCIERLGYSEDEAGKRVRVTRLARRFPRVLDELRAGSIHLTGLALLAQYLTEENCDALLGAARGKSRREIEVLIAARFPKPDVPERVCALPDQTSSAALTGSEATGTVPTEMIRPETDKSREQCASSRIERLSESRWSVQFSASAAFHAKLERARELLSHRIPSGDVATIIERALDALIEQEAKRRFGAGKPRKQRALRPGSRHVPLEVVRQVWERDGGQCTFLDAEGRRCTARRFLTVEHEKPHALGGPPTVENTCLLCWAHNEHAARRVFGEAHIDAKRAERVTEREEKQRDVFATVHKALRNLAFRETDARRALAKLREVGGPTDAEPLLRAALALLVPEAKPHAAGRNADAMRSDVTR